MNFENKFLEVFHSRLHKNYLQETPQRWLLRELHFILFSIIFRERFCVEARQSSVKVPYSAAVMCTRQEALEAMNFN